MWKAIFYYILYAVAQNRVNLFSVENFWQLLHTLGCVERIPLIRSNILILSIWVRDIQIILLIAIRVETY